MSDTYNDNFDDFDNIEDIDIDDEDLELEEEELIIQPTETASADNDTDFEMSDDTELDLTGFEYSGSDTVNFDTMQEQPAINNEQSFDAFEDFDEFDDTEEMIVDEPSVLEVQEQSDIDFGLTDTSSETDLLGSLLQEDTWTSDVQIGENDALNNSLTDDVVDKNSFDSLFVNQADKPVSTGTQTSILSEGACDNNAFSFEYININNIIVWKPRIRNNTDVSALLTSIKNDGLLQPLTVAPAATEGRYVLIKGARRLMACAQLGMKNIPCVVNKQISNSDIHIIEPLYSHTKPYSVSEMLGYIDYIKKERNITAPSIIEYLLNLNSGDYLKLMDVMDDNDDEIVGALLTGQLDIGGAFKKLEQKRKKAGREQMANSRTQRVYGDAAAYGADNLADSGETNTDGEELTEEEKQSLIDTINGLEDMSDVDGEQLRAEGDAIQGYQAHKQDPNNRERIDPKLRKAVLARDNNTCRICEQISGQEYVETLDVHHVQPVFLSGADDINNLLCACVVCHKLIHLYARNELHVRPFSEMNESEATKFKRIIKLGNVIRQGMVNKGMKKEQLKKLDNADTIGRRLKGSSDQVAD